LTLAKIVPLVRYSQNYAICTCEIFILCITC